MKLDMNLCERSEADLSPTPAMVPKRSLITRGVVSARFFVLLWKMVNMLCIPHALSLPIANNPLSECVHLASCEEEPDSKNIWSQMRQQ